MPHKRAQKPNGPRTSGGGRGRVISHLKWKRREALREGRSLSPLLPKVTSSSIIREAAPQVEVITIEDSPSPPPSSTPIDWEALMEAVTPPPPHRSPKRVLTPPPQLPSIPVPSTIPPCPGVVEILDTGSATKVPDHKELTPEFLKWFDDLYQSGQDLTFILDDPSLQYLSYSYPP